MTKKKWFVFILITILLVVFYYIVAILKGIEYKDKITICISFTGLFATFGGAYLGAKISGDNAREILSHQLTINSLEKKFKKNIEFIEENNKLVDLVDSKVKCINVKKSISIMKYDKENISEYLLNIYYDLKVINMLLNDYNQLCNVKNLKGNEISVQVLKDFEETKRTIIEIGRFYKQIESFIESNAISKYYEMKGIDRHITNKMYTNIDSVTENNVFVSLDYDGDKEKIELSFNEAFAEQKKFLMLKEILQLHKITSKFDKRYLNRRFRSEQGVLNYINSLYSQLL